MALGSSGDTITTGATFIPEIWANDWIASYESNLVLAKLVKRYNFVGKKGDTYHIPTMPRSAASAVSADTELTPQAQTASSIDVLINKHYYRANKLDDMLAIQSLTSLRQSIMADHGYALAVQVDFDLHVLGTGFQGGTLDATTGTPAAQTLAYDAAVIGGNGSTLWDATTDGNATAIADAGIRRMIQTLDDADVPADGRSMIIPPVSRNTILGLSRFTEQAFVGDGDAIKMGKIANLYGVNVYVSSRCPTILDAGGTNSFRVGMMFHKDAMCLVEQLRPRVQSQYKLEFLGDLMVTDTIYGVKELRDTSGVAFVVPA